LCATEGGCHSHLQQQQDEALSGGGGSEELFLREEGAREPG